MLISNAWLVDYSADERKTNRKKDSSSMTSPPVRRRTRALWIIHKSHNLCLLALHTKESVREIHQKMNTDVRREIKNSKCNFLIEFTAVIRMRKVSQEDSSGARANLNKQRVSHFCHYQSFSRCFTFCGCGEKGKSPYFLLEMLH